MTGLLDAVLDAVWYSYPMRRTAPTDRSPKVTSNPYERAARAEKVTALVAVLTAAGCDTATLPKLDADARRTAELAARLRRPASPTTWEQVGAALAVAS